MIISLTEKDKAALLKMWRAGKIDTDLISGLKDKVDNQKTLSMDEIKALQYELWREDCGFSDEDIAEEKRRAVKEGEEAYYLLKYIEARRKRKERNSGFHDKEILKLLREAERELVELNRELEGL